MSLSQFDVMFRHPNTAFCSPTYSLARIKPNHESQAPTLCSILTESLSKNRPKSISLTSQSESIAVTSSSPVTKTLLTLNLPCSTTSTLDTVAVSVEKGKSNLDQARFTSESFSNASTVSSDSSLISWLRSGDPTSSAPDVSIAEVTTSNLVENRLNTYQNRESNNELHVSKNANSSVTIASKKGTHSFNIASLMKSREDTPDCRSVTCTAQCPSLPNTSLKDTQVSFAVDNVDFNTATPKDVFQQSFDNEILECLQNIHGLGTPESPGKNATNSMTQVNSDWTNFGNSAVSGRVIPDSHPRSSSIHAAQIDPNSIIVSKTSQRIDSSESRYSLRDNQQHQVVESYPPGQFDRTVSINVPKSRSLSVINSLSNTSYPSVSYLNYVTAATTSVLWQPAITNVTARHAVSNLSALPGCFSPISYFTNGNFHMSQNCSSSNPAWAGSSQTTYSSTTARVASELTHSAANFEHPKKRKLQSGASKPSVSKRKKSTNKHVQDQEGKFLIKIMYFL